MATHSSILAWRTLWSLVSYSPWGHKKSNQQPPSHPWDQPACPDSVSSRRSHQGFSASPLLPLGTGGFPGGSDGKESACNTGDLGSIPGKGRFPWRKAWQPTPVFLTGEAHGQRSLSGYSPWGCKASDTTEGPTHSHFFIPYPVYNRLPATLAPTC